MGPPGRQIDLIGPHGAAVVIKGPHHGIVRTTVTHQPQHFAQLPGAVDIEFGMLGNNACYTGHYYLSSGFSPSF
jgi:hypothetical protein